MIKNQRLFTFGCSLTSYNYPTWADIISDGFTEYQNWGRAGAGNNFIANSVAECHQRNKFETNDTVIILWSGLARTDYYQINHWGHLHNQYFDLNNSSSFSCPQGYEMLSFAWISNTIALLSKFNVNWKMFHWQEFDQQTPAYDLYQDILQHVTHAPFEINPKKYNKFEPGSEELIKDLYLRLHGPSWPSLDSILDSTYINSVDDEIIKQECVDFLSAVDQDPRITQKYLETPDSHPSPLQHLKWVKKYLPKHTISSQTEHWINDIDNKLLNQKLFYFRPNQPTRF